MVQFAVLFVTEVAQSINTVIKHRITSQLHIYNKIF